MRPLTEILNTKNHTGNTGNTGKYANAEPEHVTFLQTENREIQESPGRGKPEEKESRQFDREITELEKQQKGTSSQQPQGQQTRQEPSKTIADSKPIQPDSPNASVLFERLERVSIRAVEFAGKLLNHSPEQNKIGDLLMKAMEIEITLPVDWPSLERVMNDLEFCLTPIPQAEHPSKNLGVMKNDGEINFLELERGIEKLELVLAKLSGAKAKV